MAGLFDIRDAVQQISEAIASVLDIDVIISDADYQLVGDTKKHYKLEVKEIKDVYVIGNVIKTGVTQVVPGKLESEQCATCSIQDNCNLEAMLCVPIEYEDKRLGAIGLIAITEASRVRLLENQKNLIEFTRRMSELIVSKLLEQEAKTKLTVARNQLVSIMDSIDEGIVAADEDGRIVYVNSVLEDVLRTTRAELIDRRLTEVFSVACIGALIDKGSEFSNIELRIGRPGFEVHALISGRPVVLEDKNAGSIIVLKKMEDVYRVINNLTNTALSTSFEQIVGESASMLRLKDTALRVAGGDSSILITGESGTGKELFARAIHHASPRSKHPFIAINCAAMPESLIESELFGYEDGSFTGASRGGRPGKFQLANGGTIFLDEIGDMPLHLQPKLLRVLQEKTVEKLGGHKSVAVDVRLIAATNKDLEGMVDRGEFREDLFYRINVIPLHIPPLRSRPGDVRLLMGNLLRQYNAKLNKKIKGFTADAESVLLAYRWKGNVRELANVIEYAINMEPSAYITTNSLPFKIREREAVPAPVPSAALHVAEKELIRNTLAEFGMTVTGKRRAAEALGISLSTLYRKLKEMSLDRA
ncbi:PAS domain S-box-containing protein [Propionivibrio dicarboxylicus]|uniref:PAS domain S-box-containing protein n=2 Tax=Propionivibrio dicarboxylicus TaxID=83767 RepID=A0A1G8LJ22_9RHOO|nr:PAS domain S-box-containing protein [Propionivibrio dicarboxylicus]